MLTYVDERQEADQVEDTYSDEQGDDAAWYKPRIVQFWPGGRLKGPEFEGEERILEDLEEMLSEGDLDAMFEAVNTDKFDHTEFSD